MMNISVEERESEREREREREREIENALPVCETIVRYARSVGVDFFHG